MDSVQRHNEIKEKTDALTYEMIPSDRLVELCEGDNTYTFDLASLEKIYRKNGVLENPFSRRPFDPELVNRIKTYGRTLKRFFLIKTATSTKECSLCTEDSIGNILIEIFRSVADSVYYLLSHDVLFQDGAGNRISAYTYDLHEKFHLIPWFSLDHPDKCIIIEALQLRTPQACRDRERIYPPLARFARNNDIEWITSSRYMRPYNCDEPPVLDEADPDSKELLESSIELCRDLSEAEFIINLLTDADNAKITTEEARDIIKKLPSNSNQVMATHIILSRVVDKHHLGEEGMEIIYLRNRYEQPDYRIGMTGLARLTLLCLSVN